MAIDDALAALGSHPLRQTISARFEDLTTVVTPDTTGFTRVEPSKLPKYYVANAKTYIGEENSCARGEVVWKGGRASFARSKISP
jgi:hypothetical protein